MEDPKILLWPILALWGLFQSYRVDIGKHRILKIFHVLFVLILVQSHAHIPWYFFYALAHPVEMAGRFYVPAGVFPAWGTLSVSVLSILFGVIAVALGIALAYRIRFAHRVLLWLIPVLCIMDGLSVFLDAMQDPTETSGYSINAISSGIVVAIPYTLMFVFYTRRSVVSALFDVKAEGDSDSVVAEDGGQQETGNLILRKSPHGTRQAIFRFADEIRLGPAYYFLETDEWNLWSRIFGDRSVWSEDDRFLAVQEWWNTVESQGPQTSLVVLDLEMERQCTFDSVPGFATPLSFNGTLLRYEEDRWESGQRVKSEHEVDVAKIDRWEDL